MAARTPLVVLGIPTCALSVSLIAAWSVSAQPGGGPGPGPGGPLLPPLEPPGNAVTVAKANLGKALFWDEQLSSTRTVSCGTCHIPAAGGSDPRSIPGSPIATHPGTDGVFGTPDDVTGSPGVPRNRADGNYEWDEHFELFEQVTGRKTPSAINAAYTAELFWDGRAGDEFRDPLTDDVVIPFGAALETQVIGPPISTVEMAHAGRDWVATAQRVEDAKPLALVASMPAALELWIDGRGYPQLFEEAFGDNDVTPARIAMAIATYERTLFSNQTPFDAFLAGQGGLTLPEQRGRNVFIQSACVTCHSGPLMSDNQYHYIGVRPVGEDLGRFTVTGAPPHRGAFRTPSLRNVELRAPYFHNGRFQTLEEVVDFYNRGGDFNAPNKAPQIRPLNLTAQQRSDLLAFLRRPLTDPRVANEQPPFDRPVLFTESERVAEFIDAGDADATGRTPVGIAFEPALVGNPSFTVAVLDAEPGSDAFLVIDKTTPPSTGPIPAPDDAMVQAVTTLTDNGTGVGHTSVSIEITNAFLDDGPELFGRWYIVDPDTQDLASSPAFRFTAFGDRLVTCPVDWNQDGFLNDQDWFAWTNDFFAGAGPRGTGDYNDDGFSNDQDFFDFVNEFFNPGPGCS